jgi:hypothetical protein
LNHCKDKLKERNEKISLFGLNSKERICKFIEREYIMLCIVMDSEITSIFTEIDEELKYLRDVFKKY